MMRQAPRILMIRLSSLGDILHALPALRSLRAGHPGARIDWLVESRMAFLVRAFPDVDGIVEIDTRALRRPRSWPGSWRALIGTLARLRSGRYDLAIDFQGLIKTAFLAVASGARRRIGFSSGLARERPASWFYHERLHPPGEELHVVRLNLELARVAGGVAVEIGSRLEIPVGDREPVLARIRREQLSGCVIINPGGGWSTKRWAPRRFAALADRIARELGVPVVVTTAPGESHLYREIVRASAASPPRQVELGFLELVPLLETARLFVGGDTGPLHLAAVVGTPVVGIFGPTSPVRNGPLGPEDEALAHRLPCSFCYGRSCPTRNECMDIEVDEVFEAVVKRLRGRAPA
jgi:lipopolysaccharide heptosyltransferase I